MEVMEMMTKVIMGDRITVITDTMITNLSTTRITLGLMMVLLIITKNITSIMDHITITNMVPTITKNIMDPITIMTMPLNIIIMTMPRITIRNTIHLTIIIITTTQVIRDMMKNLMEEVIIKSIIITTIIIIINYSIIL
jgi:hypothetical protein